MQSQLFAECAPKFLYSQINMVIVMFKKSLMMLMCAGMLLTGCNSKAPAGLNTNGSAEANVVTKATQLNSILEYVPDSASLVYFQKQDSDNKIYYGLLSKILNYKLINDDYAVTKWLLALKTVSVDLDRVDEISATKTTKEFNRLMDDIERAVRAEFKENYEIISENKDSARVNAEAASLLDQIAQKAGVSSFFSESVTYIADNAFVLKIKASDNKKILNVTKAIVTIFILGMNDSNNQFFELNDLGTNDEKLNYEIKVHHPSLEKTFYLSALVDHGYMTLVFNSEAAAGMDKYLKKASQPFQLAKAGPMTSDTISFVYLNNTMIFEFVKEVVFKENDLNDSTKKCLDATSSVFENLPSITLSGRASDRMYGGKLFLNVNDPELNKRISALKSLKQIPLVAHKDDLAAAVLNLNVGNFIALVKDIIPNVVIYMTTCGLGSKGAMYLSGLNLLFINDEVVKNFNGIESMNASLREYTNDSGEYYKFAVGVTGQGLVEKITNFAKTSLPDAVDKIKPGIIENIEVVGGDTPVRVNASLSDTALVAASVDYDIKKEVSAKPVAFDFIAEIVVDLKLLTMSNDNSKNAGEASTYFGFSSVSANVDAASNGVSLEVIANF